MDALSDLRERIGVLEEENRQLRAVHELSIPARYGNLPLSRTEVQLLWALESAATNRVCSVDYLIDRIGKATADDQPIAATSLKVYICRLRRKIQPMKIRNAFGEGYWLDEDIKSALREMRG